MGNQITPMVLLEDLMQASKSAHMRPVWKGRPCDSGAGCPKGPTTYVKSRDVWLCDFHRELYG